MAKYGILLRRRTLVLMALCEISHKKSLIFFGQLSFQISLAKDVYNRLIVSPISDNKDFVEKEQFVLGNHLHVSSLCERTIRARSRLRSAHYTAFSSFIFMFSFMSQKLESMFHTSLTVTLLL